MLQNNGHMIIPQRVLRETFQIGCLCIDVKGTTVADLYVKCLTKQKVAKHMWDTGM